MTQPSKATQKSHLEKKLAQALRAYLADYKSGDRVEAERSQELCSILARFFNELVRDDERWNRFYWVDDLAAFWLRVGPGSRALREGHLIGGQEKQSAEWIEPFSASLELSEAGGHLRAYRIACGDANRVFGTIPNEDRLSGSKIAPDEWLFTFVASAN